MPRIIFSAINNIIDAIAPIANHFAFVFSPALCLMIAKMPSVIIPIPTNGSTTNDDISDPILLVVFIRSASNKNI